MDLDRFSDEGLAALERASRRLAAAGYCGPEHMDPRPGCAARADVYAAMIRLRRIERGDVHAAGTA